MKSIYGIHSALILVSAYCINPYDSLALRKEAKKMFSYKRVIILMSAFLLRQVLGHMLGKAQGVLCISFNFEIK